MDPIETFQHERISVLTDSPVQVTFQAAGRNRVFGNVWALNDYMLFKRPFPLCCFFSLSDALLDLSGKLEGESVVGAAIQGIPNLWCFVIRSPGLAASPITIKTQITSGAGVLVHDWREPIRQMLRSPGDIVHITYKRRSWAVQQGVTVWPRRRLVPRAASPFGPGAARDDHTRG
jgi:hypothetical protein